jgi:hypothetical protein
MKMRGAVLAHRRIVPYAGTEMNLCHLMVQQEAITQLVQEHQAQKLELHPEDQ